MGDLSIKKNEDGTYALSEITKMNVPLAQVYNTLKQMRMQKTILENRLAWTDEHIVKVEKAQHPKLEAELAGLNQAISTLEGAVPPEPPPPKMHGKMSNAPAAPEPGASP